MISRARPLLGTLVSIRAEAEESDVLAAFDAVARVHRLMNFHSQTGDLAYINREAFRRPVQVDAWTMEVLEHAHAISHASEGAFDVTQGRGGASWRDIGLLPGGRVHLRRRTALDLGGIAKGYAVDQAIHALERRGVRTASINAGGDLRSIGERQALHVRGAALAALPELPQRAAATSAVEGGWTLTVCAQACVVADALTKAIRRPGPLRALLERFGACAFAMDAAGVLREPAA